MSNPQPRLHLALNFLATYLYVAALNVGTLWVLTTGWDWAVPEIRMLTYCFMIMAILEVLVFMPFTQTIYQIYRKHDNRNATH